MIWILDLGDESLGFGLRTFGRRVHRCLRVRKNVLCVKVKKHRVTSNIIYNKTLQNYCT